MKFKQSQRWAFVYPYIRKYKAYFIGGIICSVSSTALDQVLPYAIKLVVDNLESGDKTFTTALWPLSIGLGSLLLSALLLYFQRMWVIQSSRKIEYQIRNDIFIQLQHQPKAFYDTHPIGDVMSNVTNDLDKVRDFLGPVILHMVRIVCFALFTVTSIFLLNNYLALLALAPSLVIPLLVNKLLKRTQSLYGAIQKELGKLNAFVQDTVSGIQVVKAYGKEDVFHTKFSTSSEKLRKHSFHVAVITSLIWPLFGVLGALGILLVIWQGATMAANGAITLGTLTAIFIYLLRLQFPMAGLGWVFNLLQRCNASLDRILTLQSTFAPPSHPTTPTKSNSPKRLEIKNLSFAYKSNLPPVLSGINLTLEPGHSLGIAGPIGSGKTTLVHIISGIYMPPPNTLFLGQQSRESLDVEAWQKSFSLAPQDGFLFSRSIADNILIGKNSNTASPIEKFGEISGFSRDLPQISNGYNAMLGERGINLSGGQRQRVGLARALMPKAPILVLDDTLSALDTETEQIVIGNLRRYLKGRSIIVISHRYSALQFCDQIIYLQNGEIKERGTHESLVKQNGTYAKVYQKQIISRDLEVQ